MYLVSALLHNLHYSFLDLYMFFRILCILLSNCRYIRILLYHLHMMCLVVQEPKLQLLSDGFQLIMDFRRLMLHVLIQQRIDLWASKHCSHLDCTTDVERTGEEEFTAFWQKLGLVLNSGKCRVGTIYQRGALRRAK